MTQARGQLDSREDLSSVTKSFLTVLESKAPATTVRLPLREGATLIQLAKGQVITATHMTVPLRIRSHTAYGLVTLGYEAFTVMPGVNQEIKLGRGTLISLGFDVDQQVTRYAEAKRRQS